MKFHIVSILLFAGSLPICAATSSDDNDNRWLQDSLPQSWVLEPQFSMTSPASDNWWKAFGDTTLLRLINLAVENNYNVSSAMKRIEAARLAGNVTKAGYYPSVSADFSWQRDRTAGTVHGEHSHPSSMNYFSLGLSMQWEIDVFGRIAEQSKADKANYNGSVADYDAALVSVVTNLAKAYFQLRMYQAEYALIEKNIAINDDLMQLAQARYDAGLRPLLDLVQARMVVAQVRGELPDIKAGIGNSLEQIALLCGVYPSSLQYLLTPAPLPEVPNPGVIPNPASLLRRRPDIVSAECSLAAQAAAIGIAKKDFLPTLSLSASVATESLSFEHLFGKNSMSYNIMPQLSWTLFDGFARKNRLAEARINMEAQIDSYNLTVMTAVQEVNTSLLNWQSLSEQVVYQEILIKESDRQLQLQIDRYRQGLNGWSDIGGAQTTLIGYQDSLIQLQAERLAALVTIYSSLGGGF